MKRPHDSGIDGNDPDGISDSKKPKTAMEGEIETGGASAAKIAAETVLSDENLLSEVLKHLDGRTLAWAACVSKLWKRTAEDERLWEVMCVKDGSRNPQHRQLRHVVVALGGFRRLYSLHLWPLVKLPSHPSPSAPASTWPCLPPPPKVAPTGSAGVKKRWGNDEMNLSLSLLSIRYFETMNFNNRSKQT